MEIVSLAPDEIVVGPRLREINREAVGRLKESIARLGLRTPISVRLISEEEGWGLVAGRHRLQACIELGMREVPVREEKGSELDARLWEIAENLHRADLTVTERSEHIEEWRNIVLEKGRQLADPLGGAQPKDKGFSKTARELDVPEREVRRSERIANLAPEAKAEAKILRLDDNQSALLKAARLPSKEGQLRALREHAAQRQQPRPAQSPARDPLNDIETVERQVDALMAAWNRAGPEAREMFLTRIDAPVADGATALRAVVV